MKEAGQAPNLRQDSSESSDPAEIRDLFPFSHDAFSISMELARGFIIDQQANGTTLSEAPTLSSPEFDVRKGVLTRAHAGEAEAFHSIFNRYSRPVLSFIYSLLGNRAGAEELTQETFIRAYRRLASRHADTQLSTWLFGIARNVVREAIKEKYRDRRKVQFDEALSRTLRDVGCGPDELLLAGELNRAIQKALRVLSEDHRVVFVLKVLHRLRYDEISQITGSSIGKLKTDLHRARAEMRRSLVPYLGDQTAGRRGGP